MEKFNLTQTGQEVQNILNGAASQLDLTAEVERAQEAERALGEGVQQNADDIDAIEEKIPSAASQENQLADKAFVNSSIATNTATFRGTFNLVSNLHLTLDATEQQIATALASAIVTADNNDYCFIQIPVDVETPTVIGQIDRYKFNGEAWAFEYTLNNSGFTAAQWDAINSGITTGDVTKLTALPTNAQLTTLLTGLQLAISQEEERAQVAEQGLNSRLETVEELADISIDGGTIGIASPQDFEDPTPEQKAKVATVGSIIDGPGINIHLTEQEYDALTDEQKMNGSWYFIEE